MEFRVWSLEFGFWILDFGFWILDFGFWILDFGFWILDFGSWILDFGFWILDFGVWILDFGFWISLVFVLFVAAPNGAVWILDFGFWSLDFGVWILDFGFWILVWMRPYSTSFGSCIRYFHVTPTRVGGFIGGVALGGYLDSPDDFFFDGSFNLIQMSALIKGCPHVTHTHTHLGGGCFCWFMFQHMDRITQLLHPEFYDWKTMAYNTFITWTSFAVKIFVVPLNLQESIFVCQKVLLFLHATKTSRT